MGLNSSLAHESIEEANADAEDTHGSNRGLGKSPLVATATQSPGTATGTVSPKKLMSPRDFAIQQVIDNMWEKYDVDRSGALDREETKNFVRYTLLDMNAEDSFDDAAFEHVFNHFDKDGNGTIDKEEMLMFLKQNFFFDTSPDA